MGHKYIIALTTALLLLPSLVRAQESLEYAVKANYLYKFAPFVEWPQSSFDATNDPFVICLIGWDPFGSVLDEAVKGQTLGPHPIEIRRLALLQANSGCRIAYVGGPDAQSIQAGLDAVRGTPVLTVTNDRAPPGIIRFALDDNHVRFEIDDAAAAENNLVISSKLLSLARSVKSRRQP